MLKHLLLFLLTQVTFEAVQGGSSYCAFDCGGRCDANCTETEVQLDVNNVNQDCAKESKVCCIPQADVPCYADGIHGACLTNWECEYHSGEVRPEVECQKVNRKKHYCCVTRKSPLCLLPGQSPPSIPVPPSECAQYPCLIFEDEFDTLDLNTWQHEITAGGGNWEFQYYTNNRSNSYVRDGVLYIKPTLTADKYGEHFLSGGRLDLWGSHPADQCTGNNYWGCERYGGGVNYIINPVQSARIRTVNSFGMKYGRVEFEAQMPKGDWIWPAIWMLPKYDQYGSWPSSGEIDLVESRGNAHLRDAWGNQIGNRHVLSTMIWGPFYPDQQYKLTQGKRGGDFADSFHKWTMDWDENSIKIYIDGEEEVNATPPDGGFWEWGNFSAKLPGIDNPWQYGSKMAPFDQEFYFLLNVAVGGTNGYFPDGGVDNTKPWENWAEAAKAQFWNDADTWYPTWNGEDAAMKVKYIRAYKLADDN